MRTTTFELLVDSGDGSQTQSHVNVSSTVLSGFILLKFLNKKLLKAKKFKKKSKKTGESTIRTFKTELIWNCRRPRHFIHSLQIN